MTIKKGSKVVVLGDIGYETDKGRMQYYARTGSTATVKEVKELKNGKETFYNYVIETDRRISSRSATITVTAEYIAPVSESPFITGAPEKKSKASPWKPFSYEELKALATENKLDWNQTGDERINRMWVINALKQANITPPVKEGTKK